MTFSFIVHPLLRSYTCTDLASWAIETGYVAIGAEPEMGEEGLLTLRSSGLELGPMRARGSVADSDTRTRREAVAAVCEVVDLAAALGVGTVWTLPRNFRNDSSQRQNFDAAVDSLTELVRHAERRQVRIAIENCPFEGENPICTPEAWDALFERIESDALGICLDPSHCIWQGIDHLRAIREYRSRIIHMQAKDTELLNEGRYQFGVEGPKLTDLGDEDGWPKHGWWRHRLPGLGQIDWNAFLTTIADLDYTGTVTVEHEDPFWGGTPERVLNGLAQARNHLAQLSPSSSTPLGK